MAITQNGKKFIGKAQNGEFFSHRVFIGQRHGDPRYENRHTPDLAQAERFCEVNASFLTEQGYKLVEVDN